MITLLEAVVTGYRGPRPPSGGSTRHVDWHAGSGPSLLYLWGALAVVAVVVVIGFVVAQRRVRARQRASRSIVERHMGR